MDSKFYPLTKSKSLPNVNDIAYSRDHLRDNRTASETSSEIASESEREDSGLEIVHDELYSTLEQKIDKLNDLLLEQRSLLTTIKEDVNINTHEKQILNYVHTEAALWMEEKDEEKAVLTRHGEARAQSLLDAIELKHTMSLDRKIRDVLAKFLRSDDLKDHVASTTAEAVKAMMSNSLTRMLSESYAPILERSQRRLLKHVSKTLEEAFMDLEDNSASFFKSVHKTSRTLRNAMERHQCLLEQTDMNITKTMYNLEEILRKELQIWRDRLYEVLTSTSTISLQENEGGSELPDCVPISPPQPADPEKSIIEQLMKSAAINKQMKAGDINASFEEALSSSDLSLVMVACRAAEPARVFDPPCKLTQSVLLSLIQQLATDMVHDTQLKCRYLEDALLNLNKSDPATRTHLSLVVGEVRKHLSKFISSYPSHLASRRVSLIIMAADNLMK